MRALTRRTAGRMVCLMMTGLMLQMHFYRKYIQEVTRRCFMLQHRILQETADGIHQHLKIIIKCGLHNIRQFLIRIHPQHLIQEHVQCGSIQVMEM